ncbi:hypothetical protein HDV06_006029 [Boothiomyces sp. JEL0866]|nr:hypothetical protein HDV06_006029 [Boothiomyces sp. JEL0866]
MVSDYCQETIKKPKLDQHYNRCGSTFSCIDCSTSFQGLDYKKHNSCISEAEKYQGALYKGKKESKSDKKQENVAKPIKSESLIDQIKKKTGQEISESEPVKEKSKKRKSEKSESPEKKAKVEENPVSDDSEVVKKAIKSVLKKKSEFSLSEFKQLVEKKLSKKDTKVDLDQVLTLAFSDNTLRINI